MAPGGFPDKLGGSTPGHGGCEELCSLRASSKAGGRAGHRGRPAGQESRAGWHGSALALLNDLGACINGLS